MEEEHTPGPWARSGNLVYALVRLKNKDTFKGGPKSCNHFMAYFQGCNAEYGAVKEELEANAVLAAAAPEMLEALEAVAHVSRKGFTYCAYCDYVEEAGHALGCPVAAAISKAKGK